MRIMECLRLRVQDVDMKRKEILIRDGKGAKDRITMLPISLIQPLQAHLVKVRDLHYSDVQTLIRDALTGSATMTSARCRNCSATRMCRRR